MEEGSVILDVGSGRKPIIPPTRRPAGSAYWGLDVSSEELFCAPPNSYDRTLISDIRTADPRLIETVDLILSLHCFEHVKPIQDAISSCHSYLRTNGTVIAFLPGRFSLFSVANRGLPTRSSSALLGMIHKRPPASVFPAYYDQCWFDALVKAFSRFSSCSVLPQYLGAGYLDFSGLLQGVYLRYENWILEKGMRNLAPYYLVVAKK
jgi:SAM-dependent methyltransferase